MEQPLDLRRIRAGTPQEGRRLKGAAAGPLGEMLGIQHDTCQQRPCFLPQKVGRLHQILQQLRHQFAGGRGVRLVEVEGSVFDISRCPAVMINDRHPVAGFQKLWIFHHVRTVGIHHHQKRVGPHLQKCLSRGKEHTAVLRQCVQPGDQGLGRGVLPVNDDPGLLSRFRAAQQIPAAAPTASISAKEWPMM